MYKYINGVKIPLTDEEIAALKKMQDEADNNEVINSPTVEERIAELEEALALLLSGVTE